MRTAGPRWTRARVGLTHAALVGVLGVGLTPAHGQGGGGESPVKAQGLPGAPPAVATRYDIGRRLYAEGRFAEAAHEFNVALALFASARLAFNLARSLERAGDRAGAAAAYEVYLGLDPTAADADEVRTMVAVLRRDHEATWPDVAVTTTPSGARVTVDGRPHPDPTPTRLRLPPGAHTLRLEHEGHQVVDRAIQVVAGEGAALEVTLEPAAARETAPVAPAPEPTLTARQPEAEPPSIRPWVGLGLGVLGVGGVLVGVLAARDAQDAADAAVGVPSGLRRRALESDFEDAQTQEILGFAVGGALLGAAAAVVWWPTADATPAAFAWPLPEGVGLGLRGGF